ncbi:MAG: hypothetical protein CMM25_00935 [Rhodospirillaceae bacterium]|nr:hypothetical protein [Rhodospirillaceae bacterium]
METIKAIQIDSFGAPKKMELRNVPLLFPGPEEVRIRVGYVGMNPIDAMARSGKIDFLPIKFPFTPGLEHTGIVESVGSQVDKKLLHRRVLSRSDFGAYSEYSIIPARNLLFLDDRISLKLGCAYRGASFTAWHALHKSARIIPDDVCLFHSAAGAIGIMGAQIAKSHGCMVIGLVGGSKKVDFALNYSFDHVFDYSEPGWQEKVNSVSGVGVNVIIDGNSGKNSDSNLDLLAPLGRLVYIGATAGEMPKPIEVPALIYKSISVAGINLSDIEEPTGSHVDKTITDNVTSGLWRVPITEEVGLEGVVDLHYRLENRLLSGRAVIKVGGELA